MSSASNTSSLIYSIKFGHGFCFFCVHVFYLVLSLYKSSFCSCLFFLYLVIAIYIYYTYVSQLFSSDICLNTSIVCILLFDFCSFWFPCFSGVGEIDTDFVLFNLLPTTSTFNHIIWQVGVYNSNYIDWKAKGH